MMNYIKNNRYEIIYDEREQLYTMIVLHNEIKYIKQFISLELEDIIWYEILSEIRNNEIRQKKLERILYLE